ncbi:MAG: hypothetical protein BWY76_01972 [bacterium ADurb.Bin429]|nr:MAG: hypothetical protein BWY76_01972 [bacterium ADurb.Bin429]
MKSLYGIALIGMLLGFACLAHAQTAPLPFSKQPLLVKGTTFAPIRDICKVTAATAGWDAASQTATVSGKEISLVITVGKPSLTVNAADQPMPAPMLVAGMLFVPLKPIVPLLGGSVTYSPPTVLISCETRQMRGTVGKPVPPPTITITRIPPSGSGEGSWGEIQGTVSGVDCRTPNRYYVVVYAVTDMAYVQPWTVAPLTTINRNSRWKTGTHLGWSYTVLLVRAGYKPADVTTEDFTPGGHILAVTTVEGK